MNLRKEKADGLFKIELTAPTVHLIRALAKDCADVEGLVGICVQVFWAGLSPSLQNAQQFLSGATKRKAVLAFERIRGELSLVAGHDQNFADLSTAIGDASAKVQAELDRMAGWLQRSESQASKGSFTLKQAFEIAIESAVSGYKPFAPEIHLNATSEVNVSTNDLVVISDIVRVVLGNVREHAKTKAAPHIWIDTIVDEAAYTLTLTFRSDVGPKVRNTAVENKLQNIRSQISDGSYVEKVRSEGGSGLLKLANIVRQSDEGKVAFGFNEGGSFFVEMRIQFSVPAQG